MDSLILELFYEFNNLQKIQRLKFSNSSIVFTSRAAALSYDGSRSACLQLLDTKDDSSTGLPGHTPAPPWLTDLRHLVPLQVAFEEEVKEKDAVIADYEREVKWPDKIFC